MKPSFYAPKREVNTLWLALRFFGNNWLFLSCIFLIGITIQYNFENLIRVFPALVLDLQTVKIEELTAMSFIEKLTVYNTGWIIAKAIVNSLIVAIIIIAMKELAQLLESRNDNKALYEITDLKAHVSLATTFKSFFILLFSWQVLKISLFAVWRSLQFVLVFMAISFIVSAITYNFGDAVVSILYLLFRIFNIMLPIIVTTLAIFERKSFAGYFIDFKNLFTVRAADFFNSIVFVSIVLVVTPMLMILLYALMSILGSSLNITSVTDFINQFAADYITGFLTDLYIVVIFMVIYVYKRKAKEKS
ncbi:hypothetical protein [Psittacicella hinzii]|uniref:Uncharacterized protein n=1 Tax=Psittacicella hinzii TaxID=2028575 RepID=A0A3A1YER6_9GAMM|nr:hypothetical protein [Psittacicella hinzii]RIY34704.1 hypothetical protein CKF58_07785 [Psittacicella hinzii]